MGGYARPISLRDAFRDGNSVAANAAMLEIFDPEKKNWYSTRKDDDQHRFSSYIFSHPFFSGSDAVKMYEKKLIRILNDHGAIVNEGAEGLDIRLNSKTISVYSLERLSTENFGTLEQCMSHGDLNANNIMYDPETDKIAFIDFQHTGFWYSYRDFVSFESSVRLDFNSTNAITPDDRIGTIAEMYRWERALNQQGFMGFSKPAMRRRRIPEHLKIIGDLRHMAYLNHEGEFKTYLLALLNHHWWLLVRFYDEIWNERQKLRQIGCILAAWHQLLERK
jgi:hypothetical protein